MSEYFDKNYFLELLSSVENTPSSIKQISSYMYYHRENNYKLSTLLVKEFILSSLNPSKCYIMFYIINEIIILSINKKKLDFVSSFGECLNDIVVNLSFKCHEINCLLKVYEIIELWEALLIYSTDFTQELLGSLNRKVSQFFLIYN